ncbi:MAG: tetratricopeptide repeat protein [Deltaproteobacteria bacterium]|nr:tetratricopeptide repeat protein [Deltaproteobacteria bacterium]
MLPFSTTFSSRISHVKATSTRLRGFGRLVFGRLAFARLALGVSLVLSSTGCLKAPTVGAAASPSEAKGGMVWRSGSTNIQVKENAKLLEKIFDGKATKKDLQNRMDKELKGLAGEVREERRVEMQKRLDAFAEFIANGKVLPKGAERDMAMAQFFYQEKRFIEAAGHLTKTLDAEPDFPQARNLLARCFFFLGNSDRTIREAEYRQRELRAKEAKGKLSPQDEMEMLDALYLVGAVVTGSPGMGKEALLKGKVAWKEYLSRTPSSPSRKQVEEGLAEIEAALRGEGRLARMELSKTQASGGGGNVMGGKPRGSSGPMATKNPERVKKLAKDATPFQRAEAAALDALDMRDLAKAGAALDAANGLKVNQASILVGKARLLVLQGKTEEGVRAYGEILKRMPDAPEAWHYLGMAHLMNRDAKQAAQAWETLMKKNPAYGAAHNIPQRLSVAKSMSGG